MAYKAVLFDLDGTLLNTLEDLANSMNSVLNRFDFPIHAVDAYKNFVGEGVEYLTYSSLPENQRGDDVVAQCMNAMKEEYSRRMMEKTLVYPGIPELLTQLTKDRIKMAILSNKPDDFTQILVKKLLPHWNFESVVGSQESLPKKPDPAAAFFIAKSLGTEPRDFIYLGDTKIDMVTADLSGMYPVGALWGFRSREELLESGAKALIEHPVVLLDFI